MTCFDWLKRRPRQWPTGCWTSDLPNARIGSSIVRRDSILDHRALEPCEPRGHCPAEGQAAGRDAQGLRSACAADGRRDEKSQDEYGPVDESRECLDARGQSEKLVHPGIDRRLNRLRTRTVLWDDHRHLRICALRPRSYTLQ